MFGFHNKAHEPVPVADSAAELEKVRAANTANKAAYQVAKIATLNEVAAPNGVVTPDNSHLAQEAARNALPQPQAPPQELPPSPQGR